MHYKNICITNANVLQINIAILDNQNVLKTVLIFQKVFNFSAIKKIEYRFASHWPQLKQKLLYFGFGVIFLSVVCRGKSTNQLNIMQAY